MNTNNQERRRYKRFKTEAEIYFSVSYELETKVEYSVIEEQAANRSKKYHAVSKNVSAQGVCFETEKQLIPGNHLLMEVYIPKSNDPVLMRGEVKWSSPILNNQNMYDCGVIVSKVNGLDLDKSIHFDNYYDVDWSILLESIFGNYSLISKDNKSQ